MSVDPEPLDSYNLPCLEEEEEEGENEEQDAALDFEETLSLRSVDPEREDVEKTVKDSDSYYSEHIEVTNFDLMKAQDQEMEHSIIDEESDTGLNEEGEAEAEEEELSCPTDSALGQQLESDSSGVVMSHPDRTAVSNISQTDCELERPAQTETDLDSGASSERDGEYEEPASSTTHVPVNPETEEVDRVEEEVEQDEAQLKAEEESGTEWDVYDQSEPSLESGEGAVVDQSSLGAMHMAEKPTDTECTQDVDTQDDPDSSEIHKPPVGVTCNTDRTSLTSETHSAVSTEGASGLAEHSLDLEPAADVTASTPKSDSDPPVDAQCTESPPPVCLPQSPSEPDLCGAALENKDSEAFVISESFVYLAVSAPPQYSSDCPPSPLEGSVPPSPIPKPLCLPGLGDDDAEEGSFLCSDSFVYMAAPERPQPGPSDVGSACEDTQELDLDSYSEGTQSGMDGVEFVLGSMTGDSDWESDGSALDFPVLMSADQTWDQLEPGLLQSLFAQTDSSQAQACKPQEDGPQVGATACPTKSLLESDQSSNAENESAAPLPCINTPAQSEVCFHFQILIINFQMFYTEHIGFLS